MSGYYRALDAVVMRVTDGLMGIASIPFALALMPLVRASVETVIAALVVPETRASSGWHGRLSEAASRRQCMSLDTRRVGILHLLA